MEEDKTSIGSSNSEINASLCSGNNRCNWERCPVHHNMGRRSRRKETHSSPDRRSGPEHHPSSPGPGRPRTTTRDVDRHLSTRDHSQPARRRDRGRSASREETRTRSEHSTLGRQSRSRSPTPDQRQPRSGTKSRSHRDTGSRSPSPAASRDSSGSGTPRSRRKFQTVQVELGHKVGATATSEDRPN